jgi:hypothetical protein
MWRISYLVVDHVVVSYMPSSPSTSLAGHCGGAPLSLNYHPISMSSDFCPPAYLNSKHVGNKILLFYCLNIILIIF